MKNELEASLERAREKHTEFTALQRECDDAKECRERLSVDNGLLEGRVSRLEEEVRGHSEAMGRVKKERDEAKLEFQALTLTLTLIGGKARV